MEGRWTLYPTFRLPGSGERAVVIVGPVIRPGEIAEVVPCDDAAVERATAVLVEEFSPIGEDGEPSESIARSLAEAVLRAAGETP